MDDAGVDAEIGREVLPDIDWVAKSLEGLQPVRAGRFLVHGSHDRHKRRTGDLAIEIEAGLAFGTGHHGTTSGCLEMIETVVRRERPKNALDLGTGSAVLAIAVAKLAHIPVLATDIDPVATKVAAQNVRLNRVSAYVETRTAPGFADPIFRARAPFDLIVANILARPLMRLAPDMARSVRLGGSLILSGILERQRNAVLSAYIGQNLRQRPHAHPRRVGDAPSEALRCSEIGSDRIRTLAQLGPAVAVSEERIVVERQEHAVYVTIGFTLARFHDGIEDTSEKSALAVRGGHSRSPFRTKSQLLHASKLGASPPCEQHQQCMPAIRFRHEPGWHKRGALQRFGEAGRFLPGLMRKAPHVPELR